MSPICPTACISSLASHEVVLLRKENKLWDGSHAGRLRTILVIDDDPALRETTQRQLEAFGFCVVLAADGREGLAKVARSQPDVVLCDLTMPVMDGLEFGRRRERIRNIAACS